jgi:hypothetical protein
VRTAIALGLLAALASCSMAVRAPGHDGVIDCTSDYVLPAVDTAAWVAIAVGTVFAYKAHDDCGGLDCLVFPGAVATAIVLPLVAANGYYKVNQCRRRVRDAAR